MPVQAFGGFQILKVNIDKLGTVFKCCLVNPAIICKPNPEDVIKMTPTTFAPSDGHYASRNVNRNETNTISKSTRIDARYRIREDNMGQRDTISERTALNFNNTIGNVYFF